MESLRAVGPEDTAKARYFNRYGAAVLRPGDWTGVGSEPPPVVAHPDEPLPSYAAFVKELVCSRDAVLVGNVTSSRTLLNGDGTFLFTDYDIAVERWLYPHTNAAVTISIAVAGGIVRVAGQRVTAIGGRSLDLSEGYLFFLVAIPESSSFTPRGRPIRVHDGKPSEVHESVLPIELRGNAVSLASFVDALAVAGASCTGGETPSAYQCPR